MFAPIAPHSNIGKHRIEALSDGIFAIAMTLLVLELKLAPLPHGATDPALRAALLDLAPKLLTWMLSFWVMALFCLGQQRVYRYVTALDPALLWAELSLLALIGLLPFSTALIGEHGTLPTAAALYALHLLLMSLLSWARTSLLLRDKSLWSSELAPAVA
ncbi:MAG: TMEM175 family protein [Burkholderiales bacterium]